MEFDGFDWDDGNREKCKKHGLTISDIESIFAKAVLILPDRESPQGEIRYRAIGNVASGRRAFIVFTMRGLAIRPISARYMHAREVQHYEKAYPDFYHR